jgi:hypothetical protein
VAPEEARAARRLPPLQVGVVEQAQEDGVSKRREGVSARLRFEVFKRDGFRCVYCGATPVTGPLHADHVVPVVAGGKNTPSNIVTSCAACNLGKAAVPLERKALAPAIATRADKDHAQQILEYLAIQRDVEAAKAKVAEVLADRWIEIVGPLSEDMYSRLAGHLSRWPLPKLEEAMRITGRKMGTAGLKFDSYIATQQAKYFHGILRRWREDAEDERGR